MTEAPRIVYFPLRSNAHALVRGAPIESVRRRLKLASLLFDRVLLEAGKISIAAGPTGYVEWPVSSVPGWQSPRRRRKGARVGLAFRRDDEPPGVLHSAFNTEGIIQWEPTLEPFADELPGAAIEWLSFGTVRPEALARVQAAVSAAAREDGRSEHFRRAFPDDMVRSAVARNVNRDLALSALDGVAVSLDACHRALISARLLASSFGEAALKVNFPSVENLPWDAIASLRAHPDIEYLRAVLRNVETEARIAAKSGASFDRELLARFRDEHREAERRLEATFSRTLKLAGVTFVTGEVLSLIFTGVPVVGGLINMALGLAGEKLFGARERVRWLAADRALGTAVANVRDRPAPQGGRDDEASQRPPAPATRTTQRRKTRADGEPG